VDILALSGGAMKYFHKNNFVWILFQHDLEGQHVAMSTVSNFIVADGEDEATWHVELEGEQ
jgi:hypothetical protein